ncbi:trypsin-like peptidase domain-containing protein [candidate division KSB1 bacterium]|nr:trypsin-like peptidase domain-containing protein [candidate division KSB1 bacterium]
MKKILIHLLFIVMGAIVGVLVWNFLVSDHIPGFNKANSHKLQVPEDGPPIKQASMQYIGNSRQNAITQAVTKVSSAVVGINVIQIREYDARSFYSDDPFLQFFFPELRQRQAVKGLGSGFIISPDGYLLTNEHVIHNATEIVVTLPDKSKYQAQIVASDYISDIALLKIDGKKDFPYVALGDSDDLLIGEWAIAFGNPFGLFELGAHPSVTIGIVSAVDRDFGKQDNNRVYQDMIQTDASINGGNSGGPLVNSLGEVIGVNTFIYSGSQTMTASIGLGFAIPINRVKKITSDLRQYGKVDRAFWTGLEVEDLNSLIARYFGKTDTDGVIVSNIEANSPAAQTNLKVGDIIIEVEDNKIKNTRDLRELIESLDYKSGDELRLKVFRDKRVIDVTIQLGKLPK